MTPEEAAERVARLDRLKKVKLAAKELLVQHGLKGWTFHYESAKRRLGRCYHSRKTITLTHEFVVLNDDDTVLDTLLHEVAHALVGPGAGHGPVWRNVARSIGLKRPRASKAAVMPEGRFIGRCNDCGQTFRRHRRQALCCGRCDHRPPIIWSET